MLHSIRMMVTALSIGLLSLSISHAQPNLTPRKVQDDLNWFSKTARDKANADIARIKREFHKDLVIETIKAPERPANLNPKDEKSIKKFFDEWAMSRFRNEQVNGVMILLVDEPKILRVEAGAATERLLFPRASVDELRNKIISNLKQGDKDDALTTATAYVAQVMSENHRKTGAAAVPANPQHGQQPVGHDADAPQQVDWMRWVWIGLAVFIGFWLIRALLRAFSGGGAGAGGPAYGGGGGYGPGYGGGGGGSGFFGNMLGGLFGAAAGMWMYNNVFGGSHGSSGWGGGAAGGGAVGGAAGSEPTDVGGEDPYVSGGEYGNDAGAGNAGGGNDAAAGDWNDAGDVGGGGGGDWGGGGGDVGGGGDWGGGGGDW